MLVLSSLSRLGSVIAGLSILLLSACHSPTQKLGYFGSAGPMVNESYYSHSDRFYDVSVPASSSKIYYNSALGAELDYANQALNNHSSAVLAPSSNSAVPYATVPVTRLQSAPQVQQSSSVLNRGDWVTANTDVFIRKGPSQHYEGCAHIPAGATARLMGCQGDWCQVSYNGTDGWSHKRYLNELASYSVIPQQLVYTQSMPVMPVMPVQQTVTYQSSPSVYSYGNSYSHYYWKSLYGKRWAGDRLLNAR